MKRLVLQMIIISLSRTPGNNTYKLQPENDTFRQFVENCCPANEKVAEQINNFQAVSQHNKLFVIKVIQRLAKRRAMSSIRNKLCKIVDFY